MASPAYCLYCFETLAASFKGLDPPTLGKVEELWEAYQKATATGSEDTMETDEDSEEDDGEDSDEDSTLKSNGLQPPSITRLKGSPLSSSSSSSVSSALTNPSSGSTSSSATSYSSALRTPIPEPSYPLFVTWNTISPRSHSKHLRGCIGTFSPLPLATGLQTYALTSAFDDQRFNPIPSSQLSQLNCAITLLADFTTAKDPLDWELGVHGIRISFTSRGGTRRYGATYLPDVAVEQGWTKEETIESLMRKAGWEGTSASSTVGVARRLLRGRGSSDADSATDEPKKPWELVQDFKTVRYTGLSGSADYSDWKEWRDWVEEQGLLKSLKAK